MKFLVINGPNLNLTQFTEPGMGGQIDFNTLLDYICLLYTSGFSIQAMPYFAVSRSPTASAAAQVCTMAARGTMQGSWRP